MIAYFDASALVPLFLPEAGSEQAQTMWNAARRVLSARLVYPEVLAALARAHRAGRLTAAQWRHAVSTFEAFYMLVDVVDLDDELARRAGDLADAHRLSGGDAVHLAAADRFGDRNIVVVAGDAALLEAAYAEGMTIASVT